MLFYAHKTFTTTTLPWKRLKCNDNLDKKQNSHQNMQGRQWVKSPALGRGGDVALNLLKNPYFMKVHPL